MMKASCLIVLFLIDEQSDRGGIRGWGGSPLPIQRYLSVNMGSS